MQLKNNEDCIGKAMDLAGLVDLTDFGWHSGWQETYEDVLQGLKAHDQGQAEGVAESVSVARILMDFGKRLIVMSCAGEGWMERPVYSAQNPLLAVGDWVIVGPDTYEEGRVHFVALLPRKTRFSRAAAGIEVKEQIVASNVDIAFLVQSLNHDFNPRRLERYLIATWESGAMPVVLLTKRDLCEEKVYQEKIRIVHEVAVGVDVYAVSATEGEGLEDIRHYFKPGVTVALLGSSGVGKSTLVNALMGEERLKTQDIRADDSKGKHTTTHRELVLLHGGGLILDTPGMRTLALWQAEEAIDQFFGDVSVLVSACRFANCSHLKEPGCAVQMALSSGELSMAHWQSWLKLQKEQRMIDRKIRMKAHMESKKNDRKNRTRESNAVVLRRVQEEY
jgi:ribosome biogenesis GTPase